MNNVYKITLNANNASPVITTLVFKQGDKGQKLAFTVEELDRTGATSALIAFSRSNGTSVEATLTAVDGGYEYIIQGNEFAVPGRVVADLKFYQGDTGRVSTTSFVFGVYDDTLDGLGGGAGGYSDVLEQLRYEGEAAKQSFIDATAEAMIYAQRAEDAAERAMQGTPEGYAAVVAQVEANTGAIELDEQDILDLKMLGYTIPHEMPVKNYVDGNGVFHQKVARVDASTLSWTYRTSDKDFYTSDLNGKFVNPTSNDVKVNIYSSAYETKARSEVVNKSIYASTSGLVFIKDETYTTVSAFVNTLSGKYLYYELATEKTMPVDGNEKAVITETNIQELKILGWTVPKECPVQNEINGNVFIQKVGRVDLGSLGWTYYGFRFYSDVIATAKNIASWTNNILCNKYTAVNVYPTDNATCSCNEQRIYIRDLAYTDATAFKQSLQGQYLYYELATPLTYSIADMPSINAVTGDAWDSTKTYAVKEYAIHDGSLWRCKTQHSGRVPAENTYWTKVSICSELTRIATALNV